MAGMESVWRCKAGTKSRLQAEGRDLQVFFVPFTSLSRLTVHVLEVASQVELESLVLVQTLSSRIFAYDSNQSASLSFGVKT